MGDGMSDAWRDNKDMNKDKEGCFGTMDNTQGLENAPLPGFPLQGNANKINKLQPHPLNNNDSKQWNKKVPLPPASMIPTRLLQNRLSI